MNDNKKIACNSLIIYIRLCVVSLISVALSRVVLNALGASDFGLYNVVGGIVVLLNVINTSMASSTYRYLAFEIGKGKLGNPNKIYNSSFIIHFVFGGLILIIGTPFGLYYINNLLNVTPESLSDARFVFFFSIISAAINTMFIPNQGLLVAYEKFSASAIIDIVSNVLKLIIILLFIYSDCNRLRLYSLIMFGYTMCSCMLYYFYCRKKHNDVVRYNLYTDKNLYKEMLSFSGWTAYGAAANIGKGQGSAIIINYFFGTLVNAAYAIALQVESFVMMFARSLNSAAVPQTTKCFSAGDYSRAISITSRISKYTFLLMGLVSYPLIVEIGFVLKLWLTDVPEGADLFVQIILLGNMIGCLAEGIPNLINAAGKIRAYQVVVNSLLMLGLPLAFLFYKLGCPPVTICVVYCVINFFNSFVKLYMLNRVVKFNVKGFMKSSHLRIFYVTIPLMFFYCLYKVPDTTVFHVIGLILAFLYYVIVSFYFGLDKCERQKVFNVIKPFIDKFFF